jgi:uncharacterized protein YukE
MGQPNIKVNFANMEAAAQALQSQAMTLQQFVTELGQSLQPLYATWGTSGSSAAAAMQQSETKLTTATNDIITTIMQFSGSLTSAREMQMTLESQNTSLFS